MREASLHAMSNSRSSLDIACSLPCGDNTHTVSAYCAYEFCVLRWRLTTTTTARSIQQSCSLGKSNTQSLIQLTSSCLNDSEPNSTIRRHNMRYRENSTIHYG